MNLYRWLNKRYSEKQLKKIDKALMEPFENDGKVFHKWDEMEEWLEARRLLRELRPWWQKAYDRVHRFLFGTHGLFTYTVNPRVLINRSVWRVQRSRRGWADYDAWSMDSYLSGVMSKMLAHLADNTHAYPGQPPFDTPEKWDAHLRDLAKRMGAWTDNPDAWTDDKAFETTKAAMKEFADNFGYYWD